MKSEHESESGLKTEKYKYVIIGGGTAGHAALVAILQKDPEAKVLSHILFSRAIFLCLLTHNNSKVLMLAGEHHVPYSRPPLSKDLWNSEDPNVAVNLKFKNWEGTESSYVNTIEGGGTIS